MKEDDASEEILFYGTPTCPMVPPVRGMLQRAGTEFQYINIHKDAVGRQHVREINGGNESVPTLVFGDGSTLTEPSRGELRDKLQSLGFEARRPNLWQAAIENPIILLITVLFLALGLFGGEWWLAGVGLVLMGANLVYALFF